MGIVWLCGFSEFASAPGTSQVSGEVSVLVPLPRRQDGVGGLSRVLHAEQEEKVQAVMREAAELGTAGGSPREVGRGLPRVGKDVTNKEGRESRGRVSLGQPRR